MKKISAKVITIIFASIVCMGAGYNGTLPDINSAFGHLRDTPQKTCGLYNEDDSSNTAKIKKAPRENKAYIDVILKKDRTAPYLNDLNDVIIIFEKMDKCIKSNGNVQKFNSIASSMIDHADYLAEKYADKPERHYISFSKIQDLAKQAGDIATLRCEAEIYKQYLSQEGDGRMYSRNSINLQIANFQTELENAIQILRDSK